MGRNAKASRTATSSSGGARWRHRNQESNQTDQKASAGRKRKGIASMSQTARADDGRRRAHNESPASQDGDVIPLEPVGGRPSRPEGRASLLRSGVGANTYDDDDDDGDLDFTAFGIHEEPRRNPWVERAIKVSYYLPGINLAVLHFMRPPGAKWTYRRTGLITVVWIVAIIIIAAIAGSSSSANKANNVSAKDQTYLKILAAPTGKGASPDRVMDDYVKPLLITRVPGTPGQLTARTHLTKNLERLGFAVELDAFNASTPMGSKPMANIVASRHSKAAKRLILAAHYDSKFFEGVDFIGATDSAAPCGMLLEIADLLKPALDAISGTPDIGLQLVFFDGEEAWKDWTEDDSVYGAKHLADKWDKTKVAGSQQTMLQTITVLALLDLLGAANPTVPRLQPPTADQFNRMAEIERVLRAQQQQQPGAFRSNGAAKAYLDDAQAQRWQGTEIDDDHRPFMRKGVPILHLIANPFPDVWHKQSDNELALDRDTVFNWSRLVAAWTADYLGLKV